METDRNSGTSAAGVIVIALLALMLPCAAGLVFFGAWFIVRLPAPQPIPLPPVPGANAPLPAGPAVPAGQITVNNLQSSQNLFEAASEVLTLEKYDRIQPGISYEELLAVLEIPENKRPADMDLVGPASNVQLKWFGGSDDALSITVTLKGKTVIEKSQTGLK